MSKRAGQAFVDLANRLIKGKVIPPSMAAETWQRALDAEKKKEPAMSKRTAKSAFAALDVLAPGLRQPSEIITLARPRCFLCTWVITESTGQEVEIRTRTDPQPTRILVCKRCYEEIFGTPREEKTDAKKED